MQAVLDLLSPRKENSTSDEEEDEEVIPCSLLPSTATMRETKIIDPPDETYEMLSGNPIEDECFGLVSLGNETFSISTSIHRPSYQGILRSLQSGRCQRFERVVSMA